MAARTLATPAASTKVVEAGAAANQTPSGFVLSSPGMMVNFILFSLMTAGIALIVERQNGTLQRLMTTRLRRWELIGGKAAGMFCLTFAQQILLLGVAQLFFGVDYLRDPAALLLMMVSLSLVASTLGLLLASVMKSEQALIATTVLVSMAVAAHVRRVVPAGDHRVDVPDRWPPAADRLDPRRAARASWCAGSTSPTCCPRSVSRSRGRRGSSCSPSGASASANTRDPRADGPAQPFFGLMLASLGSARPASTSIALMMPLGTGQAGWTRCSAASLRVTGPSPR